MNILGGRSTPSVLICTFRNTFTVGENLVKCMRRSGPREEESSEKTNTFLKIIYSTFLNSADRSNGMKTTRCQLDMTIWKSLVELRVVACERG